MIRLPYGTLTGLQACFWGITHLAEIDIQGLVSILISITAFFRAVQEYSWLQARARLDQVAPVAHIREDAECGSRIVVSKVSREPLCPTAGKL